MALSKQDVAIACGSLGSLYIFTLLHWSVIPLLLCGGAVAWGWLSDPGRSNPFTKPRQE